MRNHPTLDDVEEEYFRDNPEEIDDYLTLIFETYTEDGNAPALLSSLRILARVKGISTIAEETGMTRQGLQKALSPQGNPRLENITAIMRALGYRLAPQKMEQGK